MIVFGEAKPAGSWVGMPHIIMNRAFIARWTRMPHSTERLSASASSHHSLSLAAFITNIAGSDFRYTQVSFVSVTQQFNTTTSMGRLTLNVLLSFAQFEREVTAERI